MATHSSILAWEISWTEEPGRLVHGIAKESDTTEQLNNSHSKNLDSSTAVVLVGNKSAQNILMHIFLKKANHTETSPVALLPTSVDSSTWLCTTVTH